ncbi:hypothetical protein LIER_05338 [Lithospermum erythrorhizon]|uniref:Leucine-rich repeat-containing N-terminal plant-type domain-containing protein n=1 Tax=Lithospermum erythrorhizon TaxID=34254 RepID=A0AAV3P1E4_LITER
MGDRWRANKIKLLIFTLLTLLSEFQLSLSLNSEGLALLKFRDAVELDPYGSFANWNRDDEDPCMWSGVQCLDGKVDMLNKLIWPRSTWMAELKSGSMAYYPQTPQPTRKPSPMPLLVDSMTSTLPL